MFRELAFILPLALTLVLGSTAPVQANSMFDKIVSSIESQLDIEREPIPVGWLVNTVLFFSRPAGVKHMDFAVFEDFDGSDGNTRRFLQSVEDNVTGEWKPWVRTWSRHDGERTAIYLKPTGKNWEMLIATAERHEATVVRLKVNADQMAQYLSDRRGARDAGRRD